MEVSDIRSLIRSELAEVHTCLPGKIIGYDGTYAIVKPTLDKQLANGQTLAAPQIVKVPVCWFAADKGKALITVPLKPGDDVLLHFSERALETWLGGSDQAPDDPRMFDLSDAFASPMLRPTVGKADTEAVVVQYDKVKLRLHPNGDADLVSPGIFTVDMMTKFMKPVEFYAIATHFATILANAGITIGGTAPGGGTAKIVGNIEHIGNLAHSGGVITSTATVQDNHHHVDPQGGNTGPPV
jgi:hypothetical protein